MEYWNTAILIGAALLVISIVASVISTRAGVPLLLVFLVLGMLAGEDGPGGIEFDDFETAYVIGSLALRASAAGVDTYIVSGDLDGLQLVDDHIRLFTTRMGVANTVVYDADRVMERYGLRPDQLVDVAAAVDVEDPAGRLGPARRGVVHRPGAHERTGDLRDPPQRMRRKM